MTITTDGGVSMPAYTHTAELAVLLPALEWLVGDIVSGALSRDIFGRALDGGMAQLSTVLRAVPAAEGKLLERGIALIAGCNPDLVVLTQNLRLPVTKAASELVEMNDPGLYRSLSLDVDSGGRKTYTPDLLILNRKTEVAHLVDVKRSLGSYELSRIADLKNRMLAAALVVPDLLYKEHRRLRVGEVRVVILNAENQRADIEGGVWPLSHLDHLLEVAGAAKVMAEIRGLFEREVESNWSSAVARWRAEPQSADDRGGIAKATSINRTDTVCPRPAADKGVQSPVPIGFARPPRTASA
ncbi:hypothetical protein [Ciceribacter sp. L1K22]|uniref:hypothetical protein n=1 Tax=Ciceribacter sp. L1K22 TaxID=2820275 RepID=UPI001ABEC325|nr:hypothetical protein [Ciceribacter sp. L1K22]MBO3761362.1 hypothetical protein [Ciceribacter sp. L1K22]